MRRLSDYYDYVRLKRTYKKFADIIIKKILKSHKYDHAFLRQLREQFVLCTIPDLYQDVRDDELKQCISYALKNGLHMFCCPEAEEKYCSEEDILFDDEIGLFYSYWDGKKMYFKRSINNKQLAAGYLNNSRWEQSEKSSHRYLSESFQVSEGGVVLDIGGAEGNFALSVIDQANHVYIFECDEEWLEALKYTFAEYADKVTIVPKYIGSKNSETHQTLDHFAAEYHVDQIDLIKMDIEGAEPDALKGAKKLIKEKKVSKWAVCVYHNVEDAGKVSKYLKGYRQEFAAGYIMSAVWRLHNLKYPYWVKGVMRAYR